MWPVLYQPDEALPEETGIPTSCANDLHACDTQHPICQSDQSSQNSAQRTALTVGEDLFRGS